MKFRKTRKKLIFFKILNINEFVISYFPLVAAVLLDVYQLTPWLSPALSITSRSIPSSINPPCCIPPSIIPPCTIAMKRIISFGNSVIAKMSQVCAIQRTDTTTTVYQLSSVPVLSPNQSQTDQQEPLTNDMLFCLPRDCDVAKCRSHVIFFGGDTQVRLI